MLGEMLATPTTILRCDKRHWILCRRALPIAQTMAQNRDEIIEVPTFVMLRVSFAAPSAKKYIERSRFCPCPWHSPKPCAARGFLLSAKLCARAREAVKVADNGSDVCGRAKGMTLTTSIIGEEELLCFQRRKKEYARRCRAS